jgi:hypothetical protein
LTASSTTLRLSLQPSSNALMSLPQATDEVYDLARISRKFLDEFDDIKVEAVDFATLDTPAKWNSVCREAIWRNYDLMRPRTQLLFHDYFMERYGAKN